MALSAKRNSSLSKKSSREEGVLLHNGKKFAVGLTWLTADDEIDVRLAKMRAKQMDADFYALRSTVATQQGFGSLELGHRVGMPTAASLASDMLVGEWHGIFAADNGWWYVAVHADSIAPDGDTFFFSEEQAYQHFVDRAQSYKWPRTYVPESWNIPGTSANITLEKLLEDVEHSAALRPANLNALFGGARQKSLALVIGGIFTAFIMVGFVAPSVLSSERPDLNAMVRNRIMSPSKIFAPPPLPNKDKMQNVDLSSLRAAQPSVLIDSCAGAISRLVRPLPGWNVIGAVCNASNQNTPKVDVSWEKKAGTLDMVKTYLAEFPKDVKLTFNGSNQINANIDAGNLSNIVKPLELGVREPIIDMLQDRFGSLGKLDIKDERPPAPAAKKGVQGLVEQERAPALPPYLNLTLETQTPPNMISSYFDVSGLKVQNVQWNKRTGMWTYVAEIQYDSKALREYYAYQQRLREKE